VEALEFVERAFVHIDYECRDYNEHKDPATAAVASVVSTLASVANPGRASPTKFASGDNSPEARPLGVSADASAGRESFGGGPIANAGESHERHPWVAGGGSGRGGGVSGGRLPAATSSSSYGSFGHHR
jgi:hypothetical protein